MIRIIVFFFNWEFFNFWLFVVKMVRLYLWFFLRGIVLFIVFVEMEVLYMFLLFLFLFDWMIFVLKVVYLGLLYDLLYKVEFK